MVIDPLLKNVSRPAQVDDDVLSSELYEPATFLAALLREVSEICKAHTTILVGLPATVACRSTKGLIGFEPCPSTVHIGPVPLGTGRVS